jgi:hypothetical protein
MAGEGEDDLDAFFEEVSEVEAKANDVAGDDEAAGDNNNSSAAEEEEAEEQELVGPPPPKRRRKEEDGHPPSSLIPPHRRGVVVAAAAASVAASAAKAPAEAARPPAAAAAAAAPPPPPPPPPLLPAPPPPPPPPTPHLAAPPQNARLINPAGNAADRDGALRGDAGGDADFGEDDAWPAGGLRLFVGNLGNEVGDAELLAHFASRYPSCRRARVVRDHKNKGASRGFGFAWFAEPIEGARAKREMDQTWLQSRPIRIKKYHPPGSSSSDPHRQQPSGRGRSLLAKAQQSGRRNRR